LYKWEKVIVKEWSVNLASNSEFDFKVGKLWELKYLESWQFEVSSGEVWVNAYVPMNITMNFAKLKIDANTHLSLAQNEMWTTIYLITWFVEVSNLGNKSSVLAPWEKITISRQDASRTDVDLSLLKENIDQFFLKSDWYILNKWASFWIKEIDPEATDEPTNQLVSSGSSLLTFNNLIDASNVSSSSINISWTYSWDNIAKIVVNGKEAVLDTIEKSFRFENVAVPNRENDLVFKVLDASNDVLSRFVYTIYYSWWTTTSTPNTSWTSWGFNVQNYNVDGSQFTFTAPTTSNTYTTSESFVTIRWKVLAKWIDSVMVNDYKLSSYETSGWTWRYHASKDNNNLADGTNVYEIKYYSGWSLLYTNYFTIIKKEVVTPPPTTTTNTGNTPAVDPNLWSRENPEPQ
jgi:hypothetical protein